jgi:ABC-type Zn uptake system ZnuABC Zn-binding protein ZnuA
MSEKSKIPEIFQHLIDKMEEKNMKIVFGLEAQGHIPTIEKILNEFGSNEYAWEKSVKKLIGVLRQPVIIM